MTVLLVVYIVGMVIIGLLMAVAPLQAETQTFLRRIEQGGNDE